MRICSLPTVLLALHALGTSALGQTPCDDAENHYDVPATGSSPFSSGWTQGGPDTWGPQGTAIDGGLCFETTNSSGIVTVDGIDANYTGITGLWTTGSAGASATLVLEGTGSLSFYNGGGQISIEPRDGLTLSVRTIFNGDVHLSTEFMTPGGGESEQLTIDDAMTLLGANATLTVSGSEVVQFNAASTLSMNGQIVVGRIVYNDQHEQVDVIDGTLQIDAASSLNGNMSLAINGADSIVFLGSGGSEVENFVFTGLSGNGRLITQSANMSAHVTITGGGYSEFTGTLGIAGDFTVQGENTVLYYQQDESGTHSPGTVEGAVNVTDGASFFIGRNEISGIVIPTLYAGSINVSGGGMFGGDGWVGLDGGPTLNITDGWLVGGDYWTGQGQLVLDGTFTGTFNGDAGILVTVDTDNPNTYPSYITWSSPATVLFMAGANIHINMIGTSYLSSQTQLTLMQSTALSPQGEPMELILAPGLGYLDLTTNRVTRYVEVINNFTGSFFPTTDKLIVRIGADYAAPAGDLAGLGGTLNSMIPIADADPDSFQAQLLGLLDSFAVSTQAYQQALSWLMPTTQFAADRAVANNMFYEVQRRNLRELAIGSRAPGMVRAAHPQLLATSQEGDAVDASVGQQHPPVIIQPDHPKERHNDVFHSLFVDGYGQWDSIRSIAFVPGYSSRAIGVEGGWGIALADGLTVGVTAGWERDKVTLDNNLGNIDLDSFRGAPFLSWSGLLNTNVEQYAILTAGGGYNYGSGSRNNVYGDNRAVELHGWEFDVEGTVGTRVPMGETVAIQPEASLRYSLVHFNGSETQAGTSYGYNGDDFQFVNGRIGLALEWFGTPAFRMTGRVGYQGQYLNWGTSTWTLPNNLGEVSESPGSGSISQIYTGLQLEWTPSWNVAVSINYDGAFGDATQNSISGGVLFRF